jgi:hypothetical protein
MPPKMNPADYLTFIDAEPVFSAKIASPSTRIQNPMDLLRPFSDLMAVVR